MFHPFLVVSSASQYLYQHLPENILIDKIYQIHYYDLCIIDLCRDVSWHQDEMLSSKLCQCFQTLVVATFQFWYSSAYWSQETGPGADQEHKISLVGRHVGPHSDQELTLRTVMVDPKTCIYDLHRSWLSCTATRVLNGIMADSFIDQTLRKGGIVLPSW